MAEMVLLKCDAGSRSAVVLCPGCGRISRQALSQPYSSKKEAEFLRAHICPICSSPYRACSPNQAKTWAAALSCYTQGANAYNRSVRETYERRGSSVSTSKQEGPTKPPLKDGYSSLASVLQQVAMKETIQPQIDEMNHPALTPEEKIVSTPPVDVPAAESFRIPDENLDRKIERWKRELLDTGKRNKMINYRETKRSTLQILEPGASELFNRLAFSEKSLSFQKPISKDSDLRLYSVIALMETLSYNLNVQQGDIKTSGTIIEREKTLKNLRSKAKLAQEEQGTNILYLCFGFIYWRENNRDNSPWCKAPLLMMPVTLGLKSLSVPYTLSRDDDEIEVNPTLDYLFNTEYNIDLPTFELKNRGSFDDYLAQIEELVDKRGWKVVPEVSLGLLSFLKISMYHDLNNNRDRMQASSVLRAMAGDRATIADLPNEVENFDFDKVDPKTWHEVVDSDSSQEEAILLSKLGVSFVMQGPPGTGKSQTITNIIAEGLADGKKILFVSEKAAALQVVLKRLMEVHLDDFCLSLHNYKANKKEIVDSIGANLSLPKGYIDSSVYNDLTELFHDRQFLDEYAEQLHRIILPLEQSVYMVFGKLSKLGSATEINFIIDDIAGVAKDKYTSLLYCVLAFEKALRNLGGTLTANPWYDTKASSSGQNYKNLLEAETKGLSGELRKIASLADDVNCNIGIGAVNTFIGAEKLLKAVRILRNKPAYVNLKWLNEEKQRSTQVLLEDARSHAGTLHHYQQLISGSWRDGVYAIDAGKIRENFCGDYSWIYNTTGSTPIEQRLEEERNAADELLQLLESILGVYRDALGLLAYDQPDTIDNIKMVSEVLSLVAEAPYMEASWFDVRRNAEIVPLIEDAMRHSRSVATMVDELLKEWEPTALDIDAEGMLIRFKTEYVGMFHKLKEGYKEDMKALRRHSKAVGIKIDEPAAIAFLQKIRGIQAEKHWFDLNRDALVAATGTKYRDADTDWNSVRESMAAALSITSKFPYSNISETTITSLLKITESLQLSGAARKYVEGISGPALECVVNGITACKFIDGFTNQSSIERDVIPQIKLFMDNCAVQSQHVASFSAEKRDGLLTYTDITTLLASIEKVRCEQKWFDDNATVCRELFGELNHGADSPWEELSAGLICAEQISREFEGNVPQTIINLLSEKELIFKGIDDLEALMDSAAPKVEAFEAQFVDCDFKAIDMIQLADRYDACMDSFSDLNKWLDYAETRAECDKHGLADFTSVIAAKDNSVVDVKDAFERGFYTQWLMRQLDTVPAVQTFRKRVHEQRGERFSILDTKQYEIARKRIRESIIKTYPSVNNVAKAGSELGILRHEMEKKRRIMPVRKLFQKIPNLLLTLKPCLMMSPLSVAYFLEANSYYFDMVIFDEASQIFPQDAIGAIFRAKQVVIAGDTRQLPPTNFFSASTSNASDTYDDDEELEEEVYDSILEETANILPNRTLLWHYRSKHEHLIAFSNQQIYKNELVTFPSSNESEPDTGVEFVYVEDGYYEGGGKNCNVLEAKRCVELAIEHIERHPERSLGIIAFSEKQQQAILLEIQRFREKNPKYEEFFQEGKEDEFFVKNLENVQGDERDTILFSVGYARTKDQKANGKPMSMRFGPLGVAGGERRLNVAITRAKINIKLVSSILPSDIDISRTESEGIRMLRSYIEFAMNGEASLAATHRNGVPDDFADVISKYIQDHGYKLKQYVGCSGYKIDIAIQHPSDTIEQLVAGIECDGFSYVAARTARDRDRLRSTILKNMGWNLYRVWSTEWYKNPDIEGKKLLTFIDSAIKDCDEKVKWLEEEKRKAEERRAEEAKTEEARRTKEAREEKQKRQRELEMRAAALKRESGATSRTRRIGETTKMDPRSKAQSTATSKEKPVAPDLAWVKKGVAVRHSVFGDGVIESITGRHVMVTFLDSSEKTFLFPDAFANGHLTRKGIATKREVSDNDLANSVKPASAAAELTAVKGAGGKPNSVQSPIGLLDALRIGGFKYIDNRATSSILWVLYASERQEDFERIVSRYSVQWRLEKRGALATGNAPAWRVMFN